MSGAGNLSEPGKPADANTSGSTSAGGGALRPTSKRPPKKKGTKWQPPPITRSPNAPNPTLDDQRSGDLPGLYVTADAASIQARKSYFTWLRAELVLLALAAIAALFAVLKGPEIAIGPIHVNNWPAFATTIVASIHAVSWAGIVAGVFGLAALGARLYRHAKAFDTRWYETRAAAESVKSATWRYAVGGRPFSTGGDEVAANQLFIQRMDEALTDVASDLKTLNFGPDQIITPAMKRLRAASLDARQAAYQWSRIQDQEIWYYKKAATLGKTSENWHTALVAVEALGFVGAVLMAFHLIPINVQSVIAAIASAIITWTQAQRYTDLEASYGVTGSELNSIDQAIGNQKDEASWSTFVDEAEEACSREHRLWRVTRDAN